MEDSYPSVSRWTDTDYRVRPRDLDFGIVDLIIDRLSNGELLLQICQSSLELPLPSVFLDWVEEDERVRARYEKALERGADVQFDAAIIESRSRDPATAGVRSRALMWRVEKSAPGKYGTAAAAARKKGSEDERDDRGTVAAEFRRRIEQMAQRAAQAEEDRPATRPDEAGAQKREGS